MAAAASASATPCAAVRVAAALRRSALGAVLVVALAVVGVVIQAGSMNLQQIVVAQNSQAIFGWDGLGNPFVLTQGLGFLISMNALAVFLRKKFERKW